MPRGNKTRPKTTDTPGLRHGRGGGEGKKSPEKMMAFLAMLASGASPTKACVAIGIDRRTAYNWKEKDEEFSAAWDSARESGYDLLEDEARRRAVDGVKKAVYFQGVPIDTVIEYSDSLLAMMLKGYRSNVFRDKVEHTGAEGGAIQHEVTVKFVRAGDKK